MKKIPISIELRDYIERLNYEEARYNAFLRVVTKDFMTEEEWNSSLEYYRRLHQEAFLTKKFALEEIQEFYNNEIDSEHWYIDFKKRAIYTLYENETIPMRHTGDETFSDYLIRLYPEKRKFMPMEMNGEHTKNITLQVTDQCNMACTYCYQHSKKSNVMTFDTAKEFLTMILDDTEKSNTYITSEKSIGAVIEFIGGEPWIAIDLINEISQWFVNELFKRKHPWAILFAFNVCSNGLLHFDPRVQNYLKRFDGCLGYGISIDGNKELHDSCRIDLEGKGTYDRAIAAVHDYQTTFNRSIGSKMTLAPENVDKTFEAIKSIVGEQGYRHVNLNCVYEEGWNKEYAKILYWELHKITDWLFENNLQNEVTLSIFDELCGHPKGYDENENWCGGCGLMIAMDYKGDIFPCLRYMETSSNTKYPSYIIGNIKDGINILPEHKERVECMACVTRRSQSTDECFNCPIASGCGWCSAYNYELYGTPNKRATFICDMHKARTLANVYHWKRMGIDFSNNCPKEWAIEIIGEKEFEKLKNMEVDV